MQTTSVQNFRTFTVFDLMAFFTRPEGYKKIMLNSTEHEISTAHKIKIPTNEEVSSFKSLRCCIYPANKFKNANNCWHFNIYVQDKFHA